MIRGTNNLPYAESIDIDLKNYTQGSSFKPDEPSNHNKNNSYYSPNNDHSSSRFDQSNTLANLLMFESGANDQQSFPNKKGDKRFTGLKDLLEQQKQELQENDIYPEYYRDNRINAGDEQYSQQSEDNLCNFLLKLFGILAYKVRIMQRASFENMFIEASKKFMLCKYSSESPESAKSTRQQKLIRTKQQQRFRMLNLSKSQSIEGIIPIKQQNQSELTKKESGITFNNMKNEQDLSRNQSQFFSRPQSNLNSNKQDLKNSQDSCAPFAFNSNIKRKHVSSFSHPTTKLETHSTTKLVKKVQIDSIQSIDSISKKKQTILIKSHQQQQEGQVSIKLEESPYEYFQRNHTNRQVQLQNKKIYNLSNQNLPSQVVDLQQNAFFQGIQALIQLSLYSNSNSQDHSSSSEYLKIYQNKGILIHYETDQNTEQESKDKSLPKDNNNIKQQQQRQKYSAAPFSQRLVKNGYAKEIRESFYMGSPEHIGNSPVMLPNNKIQKRPQTSIINNNYMGHLNNLNNNIKSPRNNYIINRQLPNQIDTKYPHPSRQISQIRLQKSPNHQRPVSHFQIRNLSRTKSSVAFHYPTAFPTPSISINPSPNQSNQINIRYVSPQPRPKSQQPKIYINRNINTQNKSKQRIDDKIHVVRSQYFFNNQPSNYPQSPTHNTPLRSPIIDKQKYSPIYPFSLQKVSFEYKNNNIKNQSKQFSCTTSEYKNNLYHPVNTQKTINKLFDQDKQYKIKKQGADGLIKQYYDMDPKRSCKSKKKLQLVSSKDDLKYIDSSNKKRK